MAVRTSAGRTLRASGPASMLGALAVALVAALVGIAFGVVGAEAGPWTMVAIPAGALWFAAVLARPVWSIMLVFVSLPIALTSVGIGSLQVIDIVTLVAVGGGTLAVIVGKADVSVRVPAFGWALALCAAGLLAVPGALDTTRSTTRMVSVIAGFLLAVVVVAACRELADLRLLIATFLVIGLVMTVVAFQNLSAITPVAGASVVRNRPSGVFGDPNEFGSFCVILLMVALGAVMARVGTWTRVLAGVVAAFAVLGLALSLSRGSWIGAAIGVVGLMILLPRARRVLAGVFVLGAVLGLSLGALRADAPEVQIVRERLGSLGAATDNPYDKRPAIWAEAVREIQVAPLFGFGPSNFPLASAKEASGARTIGAVHAHNVLLTVGAEAGVPAMLFLVAMTIAVGLAARRAVRALQRVPESALIAGVAAALLGEAGHGLIDNTAGNPMLLTLLWALTGVVLAADRLGGTRPTAGARHRVSRDAKTAWTW